MASSLEECVQREHAFAIVDEVDNILIDEARTPLIISGAPSRPPTSTTPSPAWPSRWSGEEIEAEAEVARRVPRHLRGRATTTSTTRSTRPSRRPRPGVDKAEKFLGVENLYLSEHGTLVNHLIQSLKAESLFKRDNDYAVIDGEVKIIDEFTGRILEGRRWSEGLHQAVEAKEGVAIREENQTLATITLQNYFRLYDKLSGMTGTALTEATEFMKIYEIPVVEIPTNRADGPRRPQRPDLQDQGRQVEGGRQRDRRAPRDAASRSSSGTISVEVSEMLSGELDPRRDQARGPEREARVRRSARARRSPRRAASARSRSPPTWPAAASTSSSAATPSSSPSDELRKLGVTPGRRELRGGARRADRAGSRSRCKAEGDKVREARRPVHLRHRAPRVAPDRQPAARPLRPPGRPGRVALLPLRRGRPDPPVRRRPDLQDPRPPRPGRRRGRGVPARGEDADAARSRTRRRRSRSRTS